MNDYVADSWVLVLIKACRLYITPSIEYYSFVQSFKYPIAFTLLVHSIKRYVLVNINDSILCNIRGLTTIHSHF